MTAVEFLGWIFLVVIALRFSIATTWDKHSVASPPGRTGSNPRPLRGLDLQAGNQQRLEAAPHRGRLVAWGGSIFGGRR